jgi:hypothetical protein
VMIGLLSSYESVFTTTRSPLQSAACKARNAKTG